MSGDYVNNKFVDAAITHITFIIFVFLILPLFFIFKFMYTTIQTLTTSIQYLCKKKKNMRGKVVVITGASSGIGEHLAYEYAKKGAFLVIVARRESRLRQVAETARKLGSPDVLALRADVSNVNDCRRFVNETINHFGRLDHLVNNAGIGASDSPIDVDVTKFAPVMFCQKLQKQFSMSQSSKDINFWGSIYPTYFAVPHLRKSKGNIVVNSSGSAIVSLPKAGFYAASKAAVLTFYDSLRLELAGEITVSIVILGFVESEMTQGKELSDEGVVHVNSRFEDVVHEFPVMGTEPCARAIVEGVCRGDRYITLPQINRVAYLFKYLCPQLMDWLILRFYISQIQKNN